jgi:hypothetical protein
MDDDAPSAARAMMVEELQAEAELRMRDILQCFDMLPQDTDGLFNLLKVIDSCRGKLPRVPWATGYGQKLQDTTDSLH